MLVNKIKNTLLGVFLIFCLLNFSAYAADSFQVEKIDIVGLQRIDPQTVREYLPVHEGETVSAEDTSDIINALYKTGFFSDVSLSRQGNVLVIHVIERATIGMIRITGNKKVKTKDLQDALKRGGIQEGEVLDQSVVEGMKRALLEQYYALGRYDASVETSMTQQSRNRVELNIHINEGHIAKVKEINIIGNKAFSTKKLLKEFNMAPTSWWEIFSSRDDYSQDKLQQDLDNLRSFYFDRGYIQFKVDSSQVTITPNRKDVYITVHVTEGAVYRVRGFGLSGNLLGEEAKVRKLVLFKPNDVFSRIRVLATNSRIERFYGDQGYANAKVNTQPDIDEATKQVFLNFVVNLGGRVYVRNINYTGNTKTADYVMRRETRQMEGGVYSVSALDETKRRLSNLGYLDNIQVSLQPIPGKQDQVDINYSVKEASSATVSAQVGYSDTYGILYGANVVQKNFRGTGKSVSLGFNNSQYAQTYSFSYFDPYYTLSGISRGFSVFFQQTTPGAATDIAPYTLDSLGAAMSYQVPMSEYDRINFSYGYEYLHVKTGTPSQQITDFIEDNGDHFNNVKLLLGWMHNNYDRAVFPTKGFNQWVGAELGLPLLPHPLDYYKLNYDATLYQPIWKDVIVMLNGSLGYGNGYGNLDQLPFFKNYYAGGMGTVRGYRANSLGPRDSNNNPFGGNVFIVGNFNLIIPNPISERIRTSVFFDAGNVYEDQLSFSKLRCSTGVEVDWVSPIGLLRLSLAKAINPRDDDVLEAFQFSIGTSF